MSLEVVPMSLRDANAYVERYHRHSGPVRGMKFALGVVDSDNPTDGDDDYAPLALLGVALVGRPVAAAFDDGWTLEVNRLATEGVRNTGSFLYAAAWRASKALGYRRLVTYTLASESGSSLRAAGFRVIAERPARAGWKSTSRPVPAPYLSSQRVLWEVLS